MDDLQFVPINWERDHKICIQFRRDSFVCSFGNLDNYDKDGGDKNYIEVMKRKAAKDPRSTLHLKSQGKIIGQVELGAMREDPRIGYVFLYYLTPEVRGQGVAKRMDEYVCRELKSRGFEKARLSVSPTNIRAYRFYLRQGWEDIGPRPHHPDVRYMEKILV